MSVLLLRAQLTALLAQTEAMHATIAALIVGVDGTPTAVPPCDHPRLSTPTMGHPARCLDCGTDLMTTLAACTDGGLDHA